MSTVQFYPRKPSICHKPGSINELPNNSLNILGSHLLRCRPRQTPHQTLKVPIPKLDGHCAGRQRLRKHTPVACNTERLPARVADLGDGRCAVFLAGVGVLLPLGDEISIAFWVLVFVMQGWVEGAAHVVHVDLNVSCVV